MKAGDTRRARLTPLPRSRLPLRRRRRRRRLWLSTCSASTCFAASPTPPTSAPRPPSRRRRHRRRQHPCSSAWEGSSRRLARVYLPGLLRPSSRHAFRPRTWLAPAPTPSPRPAEAAPREGGEGSDPSVGASPLSPSPRLRLDRLRHWVASPYPAASPLSRTWTSPGRPSSRRLRLPRRRLRARLLPRDEPPSASPLPRRVDAHPSIRSDRSRPNRRRLRPGSTVSSPPRRARRANRASAEEASRC